MKDLTFRCAIVQEAEVVVHLAGERREGSHAVVSSTGVLTRGDKVDVSR